MTQKVAPRLSDEDQAEVDRLLDGDSSLEGEFDGYDAGGGVGQMSLAGMDRDRDGHGGITFSEMQKEILSGEIPGISQVLDRYWSDNPKVQKIVSSLLELGNMYLNSPPYRRKGRILRAERRVAELSRQIPLKPEPEEGEDELDFDPADPDTFDIEDVLAEWQHARQRIDSIRTFRQEHGLAALTEGMISELLTMQGIADACMVQAAKMDSMSYQYFHAQTQLHQMREESVRWERMYPGLPDYTDVLAKLGDKDVNYYEVEADLPWPITMAVNFAKSNKSGKNPTLLHEERIWAGVAASDTGDLVAGNPRGRGNHSGGTGQSQPTEMS